MDRVLTKKSESTAPYFAGVDFGGTSIKIGIVDDKGKTLAWSSTPTVPGRTPAETLAAVKVATTNAAEEAGLTFDDIAAIGIGIAGAVHPETGNVIRIVNVKGWGGFPIRERCQKEFGKPTVFVNDANAAAFGEYWVGAASQHESVIFFTLGTGIGAGIIQDGKMHDGANASAAECGHLIVDPAPSARLCGCGQTGHLECYASATAVIRRAQEYVNAGVESTLVERAKKGEAVTPILVGEEARKGDVIANKIVKEAAWWMGIGVVNLMYTIDPHCVLLGGAMTFGGSSDSLGKKYLDTIRGVVHEKCFSTLAKNTVIEFATLGGDAGYLGTAGLARASLKNKDCG